MPQGGSRNEMPPPDLATCNQGNDLVLLTDDDEDCGQVAGALAGGGLAADRAAGILPHPPPNPDVEARQEREGDDAGAEQSTT